MTPVQHTEIHSYDCDDSLIIAMEGSKDTIVFKYYESTTNFTNNECKFHLVLRKELLKKALKVFPCPKL